jgi:hypothetical protein
MWSHSPRFAGVRRDPSVTVSPGHGLWRTPVNAGQHCWKACWGQALQWCISSPLVVMTRFSLAVPPVRAVAAVVLPGRAASDPTIIWSCAARVPCYRCGISCGAARALCDLGADLLEGLLGSLGGRSESFDQLAQVHAGYLFGLPTQFSQVAGDCGVARKLAEVSRSCMEQAFAGASPGDRIDQGGCQVVGQRVTGPTCVLGEVVAKVVMTDRDGAACGSPTAATGPCSGSTLPPATP